MVTADVLKARLKTMGVVEHTFSIPSGSNRGVEWRIYDVGGARNQRQAWAPYFEDGRISKFHLVFPAQTADISLQSTLSYFLRRFRCSTK